MTTFRVVEHLDVIEDITARFVAVNVDSSTDSIALEALEKALGHGVYHLTLLQYAG